MGSRTKIVFIAALLTLAALGAGGVTVYFSLQKKIAARLEKGWVIPPLELYTQGITFAPGRKMPLKELQQELDRRSLTNERDYWFGDAEGCARRSGLTFSPDSKTCFWLKDPNTYVLSDAAGFVRELWSGEPMASVPKVAVFPTLITQFFDGQPILQRNTSLGEFPLSCLQAVTAIEDKDFLEHGGVSATGTLRALLRNVRAGRWAEGGSTITQQLVKNFFLNAKKTLRRKLEEQALALMLEGQLSKDQILEMYLNVIYMGQSGPYQIRGLGAAAENYFGKNPSDLNLPECAMLAALINNPGRYSPIQHPDFAKGRRLLVLRKMREANMLSDDEVAKADLAPVVPAQTGEKRVHAPYFVLSALKEFNALGLETEEGARLYTTLDPTLQDQLASTVEKQLPAVEKRIRKPSKDKLQAAGVVVDVERGEVMALIGGRDYRSSQFNRAVDSRRQIGSTVKPFVYLPALKTHDPLTPINDSDFEWKIGRQIWHPKNFEGEKFGVVPYFFALAHSLNVPAARIGQEVGLPAVAEALRNAGVGIDIPNLPSLTLGALELSPFSLAQAYLTLARLGRPASLHGLLRVENLKGEVLYAEPNDPRPAVDPNSTAVLVGMMKQVFETGTARGARAMGLDGVFAGKTGTTSDTKDAWFAGFSPDLLAVVWVGYDDNTAMGLTGAGAALPLWTAFMKDAKGAFQQRDFPWPDGVEKKTFTAAEIQSKFPDVRGLPPTVDLILKK